MLKLTRESPAVLTVALCRIRVGVVATGVFLFIHQDQHDNHDQLGLAAAAAAAKPLNAQKHQKKMLSGNSGGVGHLFLCT